MIFACALAILFLAGSVHAQETSAAGRPTAQTEDSGISTPRRVAGLGVLAFLIILKLQIPDSGEVKKAEKDLEKQFQPPKGQRP